MTIKDRFLDYWNTNYEFEDYTYNLSIFECIIYCFLGVIGFVVSAIFILAFSPIWCIPYLIYKKISLKKKEGNSHD